MESRRSFKDNSRRRSLVMERQPVAFSRTETDPTVHLLNFELYVASIPKEALSSATHPLLHILLELFQEDSKCRRNHFFSFTATSTDYSVILDTDLLNMIKPAISALDVKVTECKWRALVVEVGAMGSLTGVSSIVANVIAPLADCGVSVFCISTNVDDFVLVKDSSLQKALTCLARRFVIMCDSDRTMDLALVQSVMQKSTGMDSPKRKQSITHCCEVPSRPITHPYFCSSSRYSVCGIVPKALASIGTPLLQLMLFNHRSSSEETFFSFSIVEDDISIVLDCGDVGRFPENTLYPNEGTWRMIRIGEGPLGFDECGIVAQVSAPLAQAAISTYYICTFHTDHTLVLEENVETALQVLNERYETKLLKMGKYPSKGHVSLSESNLCSSSYSSLAKEPSSYSTLAKEPSSYSSLAKDSKLCSGSYSSLTKEANRSGSYATDSGICALAST